MKVLPQATVLHIIQYFIPVSFQLSITALSQLFNHQCNQYRCLVVPHLNPQVLGKTIHLYIYFLGLIIIPSKDPTYFLSDHPNSTPTGALIKHIW